MGDRDESERSRGAKREEGRAKLLERQKILERFVRRQDVTWEESQLPLELWEELEPLRSMKADSARARTFKYLARRLEDEDWACLAAVDRERLDGHAEEKTREDEALGCVEALLGGDDAPLELLRDRLEREAWQQLRQLTLSGRRARGSDREKTSRRRLLRAMRAALASSIQKETGHA